MKDNTTIKIARRLEELRKELRNATISYGELAELQGLIPYIDPSDTELLEAAGVPEFSKELKKYCVRFSRSEWGYIPIEATSKEEAEELYNQGEYDAEKEYIKGGDYSVDEVTEWED